MIYFYEYILVHSNLEHVLSCFRYLFWVVQGPVGGGLFRLDLADISNGVKHEVIPDQILSSPHLGAFTVDHTSFRILVPKQDENTVVAVSLDG